jgi:dephospho-CoA kinase
VSQPAVLAIVGLAGTGKSTAVRAVIDRYHVPSVYFGGEVLAEVARRGLPVGGDSERLVRESLRAEHGMAAIARLALPGIRAGLATAAPFLLVDGVYSWAEVELLRAELPAPLILLAVHAPRTLREERLLHRPVRPMTAEQLRERDEAEIRALDKATPIALADLHVVNDGDRASFEARVLELVAGAFPAS